MMSSSSNRVVRYLFLIPPLFFMMFSISLSVLAVPYCNNVCACSEYPTCDMAGQMFPSKLYFVFEKNVIEMKVQQATWTVIIPTTAQNPRCEMGAERLTNESNVELPSRSN